MNAEKTVYEMQMERYEVFKAQDPENEHFDAVSVLNGKKLYANKFMISSISKTFNSMLSKRWTKSDEPIIIQEYSYDDFKQLLTFIYSGECSLTTDNIFAMVDIAEFYGVLLLKKYCEEFLADVKLDADNIFGYRELVCKYSMTNLKQIFDGFIVKNLGDLLNAEQFLCLPKTVLMDIFESNHETFQQEELFEAVFKWAEKQAIEKQKTQQSLSLNEAIKAEITDFVPFIKYEKMNDIFFITFVVQKAFLFLDDELTNLLLARSKVHVKITNRNSKTLKGILQCPDNEKIAAVIQSQKI